MVLPSGQAYWTKSISTIFFSHSTVEYTRSLRKNQTHTAQLKQKFRKLNNLREAKSKENLSYQIVQYSINRTM